MRCWRVWDLALPTWLQGARAPWLELGWGGGALLPKVQQPQHAYLHLGGHSVSLTGEEPRVLTPVVGSEVQNDPYA